jgi:excinuclease ABC subunit C
LEVKRLYKLPLFVVALAKREEILFTEDGREIPLKQYPELYRIFGLIRDEAHRFAVNYNRKLREAKILNKLPQRERKIIERNFGSIYEVINTPEERFKKLGLNPSLKQEIKKIYGED